MTSYFTGTRTTGPFTYLIDKQTITYQMHDRWVNTGSTQTTRCGMDAVLAFESEFGYEVKELNGYNAFIESNIGIPNVALLKSQIQTTTSVQITEMIRQKVTRTYNLPAPGCNSETWTVYQLYRDHEFVVSTPRWVRAPAINSYVLAERTRIFDLLVTKERYDQCPCPEDETDPDNSLIDISLGALSFRVDAKRSADRRNLRFKIGKKEFAFDLSNSPFQVELDLDELPPIVSELSGISGITVASLSDASGQQFHPFGNVFTVPPSSGFEGQAR